MNIEELARSLNGFDEIAIEQSFSRPLAELSDTMQARALTFVVARRAGSTDKEAYGSCMRASLGDVMTQLEAMPAESEGNDGQLTTEISNTPISSSEQV